MPAVAITIQDIIDAIDSEPEMLEALRARLLSRELLELPERFAEFQSATLVFQAKTLEFQSFMLDFRKSTLEFQDSMLDFRKSTLEFQDSMLDFQASANRQFTELRTDVGILKGWMASENGLKEVPIIARLMGYRSKRLLERLDLFDMADGADTSGISRGDLDSFIRADAVAEMTDGEGRTRYLAIEFSFTAQKRDVDRAIRNAEYITRFTGDPASAAVAGMRMADEIRDAVASGDVFWHELPATIMQVE